MKIIEWEEGYRSPFEKTVLTVGNFDGVHLGHQELFREVTKKAGEIGGDRGTPAIITFDPHPQGFFSGHEPPLITDFFRKMEIIESFGIKAAFVCGREKAFYNRSAEEFVKEVLVESLRIEYILVGHDFTFGRGREGDINLLCELAKRYGFTVGEKGAITVGGILVSSTMIRNLILDGQVAEASLLLGREYVVSGKVFRGVGRGRKLGFPTANIVCQSNLMPPDGVYVVRIRLDHEEHAGVANLGKNPTFGDVPFSFEVHILDFNRDIYERDIEVFFVSRIRGEVKFSGPEDLIKQISKDVEGARRILKR